MHKPAPSHPPIPSLTKSSHIISPPIPSPTKSTHPTYQQVAPFFPTEAKRLTGTSNTAIGLIFAIFPLTNLLVCPIINIVRMHACMYPTTRVRVPIINIRASCVVRRAAALLDG